MKYLQNDILQNEKSYAILKMERGKAARQNKNSNAKKVRYGPMGN